MDTTNNYFFKHIRQSADMSLKDVSKAVADTFGCKISVSMLSDYERGKIHILTQREQQKLASILIVAIQNQLMEIDDTATDSAADDDTIT